MRRERTDLPRHLHLPWPGSSDENYAHRRKGREKQEVCSLGLGTALCLQLIAGKSYYCRATVRIPSLGDKQITATLSS